MSNLSLHELNLCAKGMTIKEARAYVAKNSTKETPVDVNSQHTRKTAAEKKTSLIEQIKALDGEIPADNASVAKFKQALTAAQENTGGENTEGENTEGENTEGENTEGENTEGENTEGENTEGDAGELM